MQQLAAIVQPQKDILVHWLSQQFVILAVSSCSSLYILTSANFQPIRQTSGLGPKARGRISHQVLASCSLDCDTSYDDMEKQNRCSFQFCSMPEAGFRGVKHKNDLLHAQGRHEAHMAACVWDGFCVKNL